jgi:hypothetical protein
VDDVERVGGGVPRQRSQQRDEFHVWPLDPREILHDLVQGAAMTDADHLGLAALQHAVQIMGAGRGERAQGQQTAIDGR